MDVSLVGFEQWKRGCFPDDEYDLEYTTTKERNEKIYELRQTGMYQSAIAKKFGISQTRVCQICTRIKRRKEGKNI